MTDKTRESTASAKPERASHTASYAASYTRREALAAMVRYSAAIGGATATIVSADDAVAQASAYGNGGDTGSNWWDNWTWRDWWDWWNSWRGWGNDRRGRGRRGRIQY